MGILDRLAERFSRVSASPSPSPGTAVLRAGDLQAVSGSSGWWPLIRESFAGAWQQNVEVRFADVTSHHAVFSCVTLIAQDIGKLRPRIVELLSTGIWKEVPSAAFSPVLRKPNRYQNRIKFIEQWICSKLLHGNTYVLKERDNRGVVVRLYILDPTRVQVSVAPDGAVYYQLSQDNLTGVPSMVTVPASEIIHDTMVTLFHPLVGISPIYACGLAAVQGLKIQNHSAKFFENGARPSGVLTAPGAIGQETANRLKEYWDANYGGANAGKVAVLGDGLTYEKMVMSSVDSQLISQLQWSAETVCGCFHVPAYKINVGPMPPYNNIAALDQQYYSQCLQSLIESLELCLDEGLGLDSPKDGKTLGVDLDLTGLVRMDPATRYASYKDAIGAGWMKPNEARAGEDMEPVEGGDTPYLQVQNYSLAALGKRDQDDPFPKAPPPAPPAPAPDPASAEDDAVEAELEEVRGMLSLLVADFNKDLTDV